MDCRFYLEGDFTIYGKSYKMDMSLNWSDRGDGIDHRLIDFFRECHDEAYSEYLDKIEEMKMKDASYRRDKRKRELKAELIELQGELEELERQGDE